MKDNDLTKIFDLAAITSIIENTKVNDKKVIGWRIVDGKKKICDLILRVNRSFKGEFVIKPAHEENFQLFKELLSSSDSFNLFLPDDAVLFQSQIKSRDHERGEVILSYPNMIAQVDRRKHIRYVLGDQKDEVELIIAKELQLMNKKKQVFSKKAFDVSAGGVSFLISKNERKFFKVNDAIEKMIVLVEDAKIAVRSEVVSSLEIKPSSHNDLSYTQYRITLCFKEISQEGKNKINKYVLEKADFSKEVS